MSNYSKFYEVGDEKFAVILDCVTSSDMRADFLIYHLGACDNRRITLVSNIIIVDFPHHLDNDIVKEIKRMFKLKDCKPSNGFPSHITKCSHTPCFAERMRLLGEKELNKGVDERVEIIKKSIVSLAPYCGSTHVRYRECDRHVIRRLRNLGLEIFEKKKTNSHGEEYVESYQIVWNKNLPGSCVSIG